MPTHKRITVDEHTVSSVGMAVCYRLIDTLVKTTTLCGKATQDQVKRRCI